MHNSTVFISLLVVTLIQIISSFEILNNGIQPMPSVPYSPASLTSDFVSVGKEGNTPDCLTKNLLSNVLHRDRRASISRPYFQHWRGSRDDARLAFKSVFALPPRSGKRSYVDENESNVLMSKHQSEKADLDTFLVILIDYLEKKQINLVYEDQTKLCFSQPITDAFIQEVTGKFNAHRHQQVPEAQQWKSKYPFLFRSRFG